MLRITQFSIKRQEKNSVLALTRMTALTNQKGGAIVWILVMVALFAALTVALNQGTRSGSATISKEQAALAATEILNYGQAMKRAVQTLQINGCADTDLSFENGGLQQHQCAT